MAGNSKGNAGGKLMKTTVQLESKEVRVIIAKFLGIPIDAVLPNRYSFGVEGVTPEEIEKKLSD